MLTKVLPTGGFEQGPMLPGAAVLPEPQVRQAPKAKQPRRSSPQTSCPAGLAQRAGLLPTVERRRSGGRRRRRDTVVRLCWEQDVPSSGGGSSSYPPPLWGAKIDDVETNEKCHSCAQELNRKYSMRIFNCRHAHGLSSCQENL